MDLRNLEKFFLDELSIDKIVEEIDAEVESFREARAKKGSSASVYGTNDNFHFIVREKDIKKLCAMYLRGKLNEWHLEYLSNLVELSLSFLIDNEKTEDAVFELSSPEINFDITPETVKRIYDDL